MLAGTRAPSPVRLIFAAVLLAQAVGTVAFADMGPPVHLQVTETEERLYTVQWRVPKALPPGAVPTPILPDTCTPVSEASVTDQPVAWLVAADWRCDASIAGQVVGMDYPYPDLSLTTVVRVDLLSGDRFAKVLSQGEETWQLPEGTAAPDVLDAARRAVVAGAGHAAFSWIHALFVLSLGLAGGTERVIRLVTRFSLGQLIGVVVAAVLGGVSPAIGGIGLLIGVVVVARQTMEAEADRRSAAGPVLIAGIVHGLGLSAALADTLGDQAEQLLFVTLAVLGMDAVHLVGGIVLEKLLTPIASAPHPARGRRLLATATGALGVAAATGLAIHGGAAPEDRSSASLAIPADAGPATTAGAPGSRRLAPTTPTAAVQSFLAVEPFEIRHEVMLRLAGLTEELGLDLDSTLAISDQPALVERLSGLVLDGTSVVVDGESADGEIRRAEFMTVDPTGALPRPNPAPEPVLEAVVGVIVSYPTIGMPAEVDLVWSRLPDGVEAVPGTTIDPENVASGMVTAEAPVLEWRSALLEDPIPAVEAVPVEPATIPVPWLALPLVAAAGWLVARGLRRPRRAEWIAAARIVLALALLAGPLAETAVAIPGSSGRTPSERQARRILAGLLPNVYRALEFRSEERIYDRLAISVTGDALADVYLEQRRTLEIEERGGAQARVEAVEVLRADEIESRDRGFGVRAEWTVGGMVTHFGHRHFRQNRYEAVIDIVPVDGAWKIRSIEILDQERVK